MFRRSLRSAVVVLGAVAAVSCSDSAFGGRRLATIMLQPQFSQHDAEIYKSLRSFNLGVTSLRIVLVRPAHDTLADTSVTLADGQDSIAVSISVAINGSEENLLAGMEMSSGGVLLFSGSRMVTAKAGADPTSAAPVLVAAWVGPGVEATRVRISPRDTTIAAGAPLALTATAFDANENPVHNADYESRFQWHVIESTLGAIPLAGGNFIGAGIRGVARVRVFTPNLLEDTVRLTLVPPATQVVTISGNSQTANAGAQLGQPFVVEVRAADNLPVPNTVVRFSAVNGGLVSPDSTMTNAQGRAQTTVTLGSLAGTQSFQAVVNGIAPATITATSINPSTATSLVLISGDAQTDNIGKQLAQPFVVELRDQNNQPFAGGTVTFSAVTGGGSVTPTSTVTDAQGRAQTTMLLGALGGSQTFRASVDGVAPVTVSQFALIPPASIRFGVYANVLDVATSKSVAPTVKAADGSVIDTANVTYASRTPSVATIANGSVSGVAGGQSIIVASVTRSPTVKDSALAIVVPSGGVVLTSSIDRFEFRTDTTIVVSVFVDMRSSGKNLGSTTIDVSWNPAQLIYQSDASGISGVVPTVNRSLASTGALTLAMADVAGFGGNVEMLRITFKTATSASTGSLTLSAREMTASDVSTDLLPKLVQVINPLSVH